MKVGILTFHQVSNYGAVLQCFATYTLLKNLGFDPILIDYRPARMAASYRWRWKYAGLNTKNIIRRILNPKFDAFRKKYLTATDQIYYSYEALKRSPPEVDAILLGSDQIWNPCLVGDQLDPAYFGQFGDLHTKRIAYAASFGGTGHINQQHLEQIKPWLASLNHISVREPQAVTLLKELTDDTIEVTLDPTLLIGPDTFEPLIEPVSKIDDPFIFVHALQYGPEIQKAAEQLAEMSNLQVIVARCNTTDLWIHGKRSTGRFVNPGQWLWLIKNASYVISNSFHATVFSLKYHKKLLLVPLTGALRPSNQRMETLLQTLDISSATLDQFDDFEIPRDLAWAKIDKLIEEQRTKSINFLKAGLTKSAI
jgi:hypothetical protein